MEVDRSAPTAAAASGPEPVPARPRPRSPDGRADLHVHTVWSDGSHTPEAVVRGAAGRVDVLALTDHDEIRGAILAREFARNNPALGVEVVVGEEISTLNGHLIGLWLETRVPPGLPAERTIALIHDQGGLAVAAHPYHPIRYCAPGHAPLAALLGELPLDAIEVVNNSSVLCRVYDARAALRNVELGLAATGGSDAHDVWFVGSAVTRFAGRTGDDLRRLLLEGRTRAELRWSWTLDKLPRHALIKCRSFLRFLTLGRRQRLSWAE
jgi:predicted metal-dependent phosphoesterase TrpH